jgi:hypothetical protein
MHATLAALVLALSLQAEARHEKSSKEAIHLTQPQLRDLAQQMIQSKSITFTPPSLGESDAAVTLRLGGIRQQTNRPPTLMDHAMASQIRVQLVRQELAPKYPHVRWSAALDEAEKLIDKELVRASEPPEKPDDARREIAKNEERFRAVFVEALKPTANGRRVQIVTARYAGYYKVRVTLEPANGIAYYLPVLQYEILRAAGGLNDEHNWYEVATPRLSLVGNVRFRGHWPGGKTRITGVISITEDNQKVTVALGE